MGSEFHVIVKVILTRNHKLIKNIYQRLQTDHCNFTWEHKIIYCKLMLWHNYPKIVIKFVFLS